MNLARHIGLNTLLTIVFKVIADTNFMNQLNIPANVVKFWAI